MTPQSGEQTCRQRRNMALDVQEDREILVKDTKEKVADWLEKKAKNLRRMARSYFEIMCPCPEYCSR